LGRNLISDPADDRVPRLRSSVNSAKFSLLVLRLPDCFVRPEIPHANQIIAHGRQAPGYAGFPARATYESGLKTAGFTPVRQIVEHVCEYGDLIDMGILEPTKVTRLALQNAASVAGLLQTTEVMVAEAPKEEHDQPPMGGGGMGGMGGMDM
jgi:hypothetical protein